MQRLGLATFDELYALSIREPERYWTTILAMTGVQWSRPPEQFCDLSRGREFPRWFVGGQLNWTDTIFAWAKDPAHAGRVALVAEREDGVVERRTFAELHEKVRRFAGGLRERGIGKGDRVGFLIEPSIEAIVTMIGLSYVGAVVLPLFSGFGSIRSSPASISAAPRRWWRQQASSAAVASSIGLPS